MLKAKTFIAALNNFHECSRRNKKILSDMRLTQLEKSIFQSQMWLSDGKFELIIEALEDVSPSSDPIINSQRELLLGSALSNKGEANRALKHLKLALKLLENTKLERQIFAVYTNLYNCYYNLKHQKEMQAVMEKMHMYPGMSVSDELTFCICQFSFYIYTENKSEALKVMTQLLSHQKDMNEYQVSTFLFDQFDFYFKLDDYKNCYHVLEYMKVLKKYHTGANFKFMRGLLDHLTKNSPLYLYEKDFIKSPTLLNQVRVLKNLEAQNRELAENYWNQLSHHNPSLYFRNFNYRGSKCLFSECLKKHLVEEKPLILTQTNNKLDLLFQILNFSESPISKEIIFEKIYGRELTDKDDLRKLTQLVYRLKQERDLAIKTKKGCYFIHKAAA